MEILRTEIFRVRNTLYIGVFYMSRVIINILG